MDNTPYNLWIPSSRVGIRSGPPTFPIPNRPGFHAAGRHGGPLTPRFRQGRGSVSEWPRLHNRGRISFRKTDW